MKLRYVDVRIEQLKEELEKMNDFQYNQDMISDKEWYKRLIQELEWVRLMQVKEN